MKMRFLTILLLLAVFVFISCDGSSMEKLWEDELGNGSGSGSDPTPPPEPAPVTYTVRFYANGGSGTMDDAIVEKGVAYTVPTNGFTAPKIPVGAVNGDADIPFAGWNTKADGSGTAYAAEVPISSVTADMTLYAQWTKPLFSVSADKKVYFAQGNLQYQASSETWKFADKQYDFIGDEAGNNTDEGSRATQSEWIDLFGWGTTGYQDTRTSSTGYQTNYQPYSSSTVGGYGPGYDTTNKYGLSVDSKSDWGCIESLPVNSIWRTLSQEEWSYLLFQRTMTYGKDRYSNAVSGVSIGGTTYKGIFLYPDNYNGNVVSSTMTWGQINAAGIVFLPAAGSRVGSGVDYVGNDGYYWSATANDVPPTPGGDPSGTAIGMSLFNLSYFNDPRAIVAIVRYQGCSVRLVCGE